MRSRLNNYLAAALLSRSTAHAAHAQMISSAAPANSQTPAGSLLAVSTMPDVKVGGGGATPTPNVIEGDFNNDGKMDFAQLYNTSATFFLSEGNGLFSKQSYTYPAGWVFGTAPNQPSTAYTPLAGDFNHDGKTDFAMLGSTTAFFFLNTGTAQTVSFAAGQWSYPSGWNFGSPVTAYNVFSADFNGDGKTDFAMFGNKGAFVFLSTSSATQAGFLPGYWAYPTNWYFGVAPKPPSSLYTPVVGDFNGDGKADFAMLGSVSAFIFLSESSQTGIAFQPNGYSYPSGWSFGYPPSTSWTPVVGDFNGDHATDFAILGNKSAAFFLSNGSSTGISFTATGWNYPAGWYFGVSPNPPASAYTPIIGDFNNDGKSDFAMLGSTEGFVFLSQTSASTASFSASTYVYSQGSFGNPPSAAWTPLVGNYDGVYGTDFLLTNPNSHCVFLSNDNGAFSELCTD